MIRPCMRAGCHAEASRTVTVSRRAEGPHPFWGPVDATLRMCEVHAASVMALGELLGWFATCSGEPLDPAGS